MSILVILVVLVAVLAIGYVLVTRGRDDGTALGDTPEAHDEVNPHDLPQDHPGRVAAEQQAGGTEGTTRGDTGA